MQNEFSHYHYHSFYSCFGICDHAVFLSCLPSLFPFVFGHLLCFERNFLFQTLCDSVAWTQPPLVFLSYFTRFYCSGYFLHFQPVNSKHPYFNQFFLPWWKRTFGYRVWIFLYKLVSREWVCSSSPLALFWCWRGPFWKYCFCQ